jgi:hypothetical protein
VCVEHGQGPWVASGMHRIPLVQGSLLAVCFVCRTPYKLSIYLHSLIVLTGRPGE